MQVRAFSRWVLFSLALAMPAVAESQPPAVWYRASEKCPNGAQFLEKLAENSRQARLAQAGDHLDFVVTLVTEGKETLGRLERQTDGGIVAIRELRDTPCERVADALALSLSLALVPGQSSAGPVLKKPAETPEELALVVPSATAAAASTADTPPAPSQPASSRAASARSARPEPLSEPRWAVGLDVGAMIGVSTQPQPRGEVFVDFRPAFAHFLPSLSLRAGVVGAAGSSETSVGPIRRWIVAGRIEACPVALGGERIEFRPCAAFELGPAGASTEGASGQTDYSLWAAPGGQLHLGVAVQPKLLWLEASGGVIVPLTRNEIFSASQSLYRDAPAVFHGSLGILFQLP